MDFSDFFGVDGDLQSLTKIWGVKPIKLASKAPKLSSIPDANCLIEKLQTRFEEGHWHRGNDVEIHVTKPEQDGTVTQKVLNNIVDAKYFYEQGYTICISDISDHDDSLRELKASVSRDLPANGSPSITCYLSPPKSSGNLHYDRQHNFFIQREGQKFWTVSDIPAIESPYDNLVFGGATKQFLDTMSRRGYKIKLPTECGRKNYHLKEGEILYVPPGHYHVAESQDTLSFHYTLTLEPDSYWARMQPHLFDTLLTDCGLLNKDMRLMSKSEFCEHMDSCKAIITQTIDNMQMK